MVVDNALDYAIFTTALDGIVTSWSPGAERLLGWSEAEMLGRDSCVIFTPEDGTAACAAEMATARTEGRAEDERWHLRKDGSRFFASGLLMRFEGADGAHLGYLKILRDITGRQRSDARLQESDARLRLAVDAARMAIWEYDVLEDRPRITPELAAFLGLSEQDFDIEKMRALYWPGDRERIRAAGEEALARGEKYFEAEFRFCKAGEWRWMMLRAEIAFGEHGPVKVVGAVIDITRRKTAEDALRRLTDTLEEQVTQRTRELLQAEEALRQSQKMEAIGQLTGGVAHDFNNLLTIIRSSVDLMRLPTTPEERRTRYMDAISDTVDRAAKLTGQLLAFARRQALAPETFDAAERLRRICDMVKTIAGSRIRLDLDTDCGACFVHADAGQFETAIVNLAVNARDAMDGEGVLSIRIGPAEDKDDAVAVSIRDTGSGIPAEALPHIFEPFYTTKAVGKGTGLGLSQVYGFARQSDGDVQVHSQPGEGTTFTLLLPRAAPEDCAQASAAATPPVPEQSLSILVVEDNAQVGEFAVQIFEELGHRPTLAINGEAALAVLEDRAESFDLVFSDVVMPGMTGIELGERIRRGWPGLRVVLTSGYSHVLAEQGSHGFELLGKPYSIDGLNRILRGE